MFLVITHITHIYLHPIYNMPPIQLSTPGFFAHQVMPITDEWNRCKDEIIYMQILMIPMSKNNHKALIKPQFLFLNDQNHLYIWPVGHSMHTPLSTTHIYLPTLPLVGRPCKLL